ncbi:MAG TPA: DnaJ domain-containing protein [Candidatus Latescibacteria bacterium]|nr:DnaJ domain-containing protein [Candidatus Latescibacterota bacterium]
MTSSHYDTRAPEIVHNPDSNNYFDVLGLPTRLALNEKDLSDHYYALSRLYHPDFHQNALPAERLRALRRTAAVNDAFTTLRDPVNRGRWWLEFNGRKLSLAPGVPRELGSLVFDVHDALERFRSAEADITEIQRFKEIAQDELRRRNQQLAALFGELDEAGAPRADGLLFTRLENLLAEISYLRALTRDIERTLENTGER